jgi:hypothetical protein
MYPPTQLPHTKKTPQKQFSSTQLSYSTHYTKPFRKKPDAVRTTV